MRDAGVLRMQVVVVIAIAVGVALKLGVFAGISVVLGICGSLLPSTGFQYLFFKKIKCTPKQVIQQFYFASIVKFFLVIALLAACFNWSNIHPIIFFIAFLSAEALRWILCFCRLKRAVV